MHSGFYLTFANFVKAMHVEKGQSWCQIQKMSISLLATFLNLGDELFCLKKWTWPDLAKWKQMLVLPTSLVPTELPVTLNQMLHLKLLKLPFRATRWPSHPFLISLSKVQGFHSSRSAFRSSRGALIHELLHICSSLSIKPLVMCRKCTVYRTATV